MITILRISVDTFMITSGAVLLLAGIVLRYWINRRKFYRRNIAGKETFSSYEKSVIVRILERFGKLIAWILILFGLLVTIVFYSSKARGKEPVKAEQVKESTS